MTAVLCLTGLWAFAASVAALHWYLAWRDARADRDAWLVLYQDTRAAHHEMVRELCTMERDAKLNIVNALRGPE